MMSPEQLKAWRFERNNDCKVWNDESQIKVVDNPASFDEKVFKGKKWKDKDSMNMNFKHRPGPTKMLDNFSPNVMNPNFRNRPGPTNLSNNFKVKQRINQQKGLSMFGDRDKDGIANILDRQPLKKNKKVTKQYNFKKKMKNMWR